MAQRYEPPRRKRSAAWQRTRRELERAIRVDVLALRLWGQRRRRSPRDVAAALRLDPATLAAWERRWHNDHLAPRPRGRPPDRADRDTRNRIITAFHFFGPGLGVPTLRDLFPHVARRELEHMARRYRYVYRQRNDTVAAVLQWTRPGAVWAMDFTEPPLPVDDVFDTILVVRDLASGRMLEALPCVQQSAAVVCGALRALFMRHGAPLVLKSDNGSPLIADSVGALLAHWGTLALVSPPGTPSYNGACEAGIGGLKTRAHHESARHGRAGQWTCDDVEVARLLANATARPHGHAGPSPDDAWDGEPCVDDDERDTLSDEVARLRKEVSQQQPDGVPLAHDVRAWASIERIAIGRALIALGYLQLRRKRITLPIRQRKT